MYVTNTGSMKWHNYFENYPESVFFCVDLFYGTSFVSFFLIPVLLLNIRAKNVHIIFNGEKGDTEVYKDWNLWSLQGLRSDQHRNLFSLPEGLFHLFYFKKHFEIVEYCVCVTNSHLLFHWRFFNIIIP